MSVSLTHSAPLNLVPSMHPPTSSTLFLSRTRISVIVIKASLSGSHHSSSWNITSFCIFLSSPTGSSVHFPIHQCIHLNFLKFSTPPSHVLKPILFYSVRVMTPTPGGILTFLSEVQFATTADISSQISSCSILPKHLNSRKLLTSPSSTVSHFNPQWFQKSKVGQHLSSDIHHFQNISIPIQHSAELCIPHLTSISPSTSSCSTFSPNFLALIVINIAIPLQAFFPQFIA